MILQSLLAERRDCVNEMRRERDRCARLMLKAHIADLDRRIADLTGQDGGCEYTWEQRFVCNHGEVE